MNELAQFLSYVTKVFALGRIVRGVRSRRPYADIPTRPLLLSLLLGVVIRAGSYLDISKQTKRRRWQHLIHWRQRISDDAFHYVSERFYLEDLRLSLAEVNKRLKTNKALESCRINGLLFVRRQRALPQPQSMLSVLLPKADRRSRRPRTKTEGHRILPSLCHRSDQRSQVQRLAGPRTDSSGGRGSRGGSALAGPGSPGLRCALFRRGHHG